MKSNIKDLKNAYEDIKVPEEIDDVIRLSIKRGKKEMRKINTKSKIIKGFCGVAAGFMIFTMVVNTSPAFADMAANFPGLGKLVRVLQFDKGKAQGGKITDGSNVNFISLNHERDEENILINFEQEDKAQDIAPYFDVEYKKSPYTMTFTIGGVRRLEAEKNFDELKKSNLIDDVYKLITLDDSVVRFNIVFNQPVKYEVIEYEKPAQVVIKLSRDSNKEDKDVYSIRSSSYPFGEELGMMAESFFEEEGLRILKDNEGTFAVEVGQYDSKDEAEEKLKQIKDTYGEDVNLFIEKRGSIETLKAIK